MALFDFGAGLVQAHQHPNGGGWVANTARVEDSVFVGTGALVYGSAVVLGEVRVTGRARIRGCSVVAGKARVTGEAHVEGWAVILGEAHIDGEAVIWGTPRIHESAVVLGKVHGNAVISGYSVIGAAEEVSEGVRNTTEGGPEVFIARSALERVMGEAFLC